MRKRLKTVAMDVHLERRKALFLVGRLKKEDEQFIFTYTDKFLREPNVIPLGPEFPLTQKEFRSDKLFPTMDDRIPLRKNSAYPDYCRQMGIDVDEQDPIVLLSTIGSRGPSSFVFVPVYDRSFSAEDVRSFSQTSGAYYSRIFTSF